MSSEDQLINSLHHCVQQVINLFKLVKATPPEIEAKSLIQYARIIEKLVGQLYKEIPKTCAPLSLFKKLQKQNVEANQIVQSYLSQHRKSLIQINILEQKLKQAQEKQVKMALQIQQLQKINNYYKKKSQSLKKSGENGVKQVIELASNKKQQGRYSLPHIDQKQKLNLLWLIGGPNPRSDKLVYHLLTKK